MLKLVFDAPKGSRPTAGKLYFMKTTLGFIPVGVTSIEAFFGAAVMIHPYRALVADATDTSWYPLVENNELLIPPLQIRKRDFKKGGNFYPVKDKTAPRPIPFSEYFDYRGALTWNPAELAFVPTSEPIPEDRLALFVPQHERIIDYTIHDTNPPQGGQVDTPPKGAYFMPSGLIMDLHVEFALEDALAYYGLIDTPRPAHPDFGTNQEEDVLPSETEQTDLPLFHLAEIDGMTTLFAATDAIPQGTIRVVERAGYTPNGYFMESLAKYLLHQSGKSTGSIDFDSEAGMFSLIGTATNLQPLKDHLTDLFGDTDELQHVLDQANTAGVEFDG